MNNRLEVELRKAMQQEDPPDGFVERVFARTAENKQRTRAGIFTWRTLRRALSGAMCLLLAIARIEYRRTQEERVRGEAVKKQLMLALRIAGSKRDKENVDIFLRMEKETVAGVMVIASAPREVTLVHIDGAINLAQLAELGGQLGIPKLDIPLKSKPPVKSESK